MRCAFPEDIELIQEAVGMLLSEMYASAKEDLGSLNGELPCAKVDVLARRSEGAGLSE